MLADIESRFGGEIDFVLSTGDLVEPASECAYELARELLGLHGTGVRFPGPVWLHAEGLDVPAYVFPGNHDDRDAFYRVVFGAVPANRHTSFEHGGLRFVWLDWGPRGHAAADDDLVPFLRRELAHEMPTIVLTHHHLVRLGARWLDDLLPVRDEVEGFFDALAGRHVLAVLSGHAHNTYESEIAGTPVYGVRSTSIQFGLTDEPLLTLEPPAYRVVTVDDGRLTTRVYDVPL